MVLNGRVVCKVLGWPTLLFVLATSAIAAGPSVPETGYTLRAASSSALRIDTPTLPDLAPFNAKAIEAKLQITPKGRVHYERLAEVLELSVFSSDDERLGLWALRQSGVPRVIVLEGGYATPRDLARMLPAEDFRELSDGVFLLRLPLLIRQGATLHIDRHTREFRMSEERAAFLVNDGRLFITNSVLAGWRERENRYASFRSDMAFRPFLLTWGGSETYISKSRVIHLGYNASKSYGLTVSQYSPAMINLMKRPSPRAWLIDSEFVDLWYGFYCHEASDLVIARNRYRHNVIYGIDPHDRSKRLIIAENEVYGTKKKHGIIVSREVNDSWIFRNRSHHNKLSGIVLDRASVNNVLAENTSFANEADGYTVYESSDNLFWKNHAIGNARHGFRVRNSLRTRFYGNDAIANGATGIYAHAKDLTGMERDLRIDPYEQALSLTIVGGQLTRNRSGPMAVDRPRRLDLFDIGMLAPTKAVGLQLPGLLGGMQAELLDMLLRQRLPVVVEPVKRAS